MAHAYVPGLKVLKRTIIKKERKLPIEGEVIVKVNDKVKAEDPIAKAFLPGPVDIINAANKLAIDPQELPLFLLKKEGDKVVEGETIIKYSSFFGLFKQEIKSSITGTIESISTSTGQIIIRKDPTLIETIAFVDGIIEEVIPKVGAIVKTYGTYIQGIFGIGREKIGKIKVIANDPNDEINSEKYLEKVEKGDIVVGGSYITKEIMDKLVNIGVVGIISGGIDAEVIKDILGYEIGVAVTGTENIPFTLVITEGFGKISMASKTFNLLKEAENKKASISGATQIRAGVIRPEIIIPFIDEIEDISKIDENKFSTALQEGALVRIIREPYFGKIAQIIELPEEPTLIPTESKVRIAKIK
ncbi:MAG: hypothetical protein ACPL1F_06175, partial [bacterium]